MALRRIEIEKLNSRCTFPEAHGHSHVPRLGVRCGLQGVQFHGIIGKQSDGPHVGVAVDCGVGVVGGAGNVALAPRDGMDQDGWNIMMAECTGHIGF